MRAREELELRSSCKYLLLEVIKCMWVEFHYLEESGYQFGGILAAIPHGLEGVHHYHTGELLEKEGR